MSLLFRVIADLFLRFSLVLLAGALLLLGGVLLLGSLLT